MQVGSLTPQSSVDLLVKPSAICTSLLPHTWCGSAERVSQKHMGCFGVLLVSSREHGRMHVIHYNCSDCLHRAAAASLDMVLLTQLISECA